MKFSLIHPSRNRPQKAEAAIKNWQAKASGSHNIEYILSIDNDEPNHYQYQQYITNFADQQFIYDQCTPMESHISISNRKLKANAIDVKYIIGQSNYVVAATNNAALRATGDCLIFLSDDFDCPQNWDQLLADTIAKFGKDMYAIQVKDGYNEAENLLTIPIISKSLYDAMGHFYHPDFRSMYADNYLYEVANRTYNCIVPAFHLLFKHNHYLTGACAKDETYTRSQAQTEHGRLVFNALSKQNGWNLEY